MRRGLVFGKFMPLHRGHQLLIDLALAECDDVTIVVYDSALADPVATRMPVEKRRGWLADLYPQAEQIVSVPDPYCSDPDHDTPAYAERYAAALEFLGSFDKVFTSEPGYAAFAEAIGADHRVVDEARELVPISGTRIRPLRAPGLDRPARVCVARPEGGARRHGVDGQVDARP
jgi:HTH-type transcriptional repressor of NAD biosynthesis genes